MVGDIFLLTIVVVFGVIVIHEYGHCFGARYVDGDAKEILIWPLGGLAYVDVPHTPRANAIATAAGPAMNVVICFVCAILMALGGFLPSLRPLNNPYYAAVTDFKGRTWMSHYGGQRYYRNGSTEEVHPSEAESVQHNALARGNPPPMRWPGPISKRRSSRPGRYGSIASSGSVG